ncbi:hypothetical protein [Natrialba aegyptia]|uniref:Uncharacterized protein n=1 Tax=Natrialba aegyptia DSM 13077 TaxID=1227491 RepID=M0B7Z8_9EURY|nr:hypothetical protein [Natrialba aegyptia]ELZ05774.1 hypothetical protein C480_10265 [Natrialba aegyptia DSM 13077]
MSSEQSTDDTEQFQTWEIGVHPAGHPDNWEHHHPPAGTEEEARKKAIKQAREDGMTDPCVYMVAGPFNPDSYTLSTGTDRSEVDQ